MSDLPSRRIALGTFATGALLASVPACAQADPGQESGAGPVSPQQFGARGDGKADDTAALQACANTGRPIVIPAGRYRITRPIELAAGQAVTGPAGGHTAAIVNDVPGSGCLWFTRDRDVVRRPMPVIANLALSADHPIRFNDPETGRVADGGASNIPYGVRPAILNCDIAAREWGTGVGIAWSKMFDGLIEGCEVTGFAINVMLLGCDLNAVRRNRLVLGHRYHLLDLSAGTFGSQNLIEHNDLLQAGSTSTIFIKTTARHARIRDNYLEHGYSGARDAAVREFPGFIDASAALAPRIGVSQPGERFTTVIRDNRIDGAGYAADFIYRYQPGGQTWGEILDPGTTGPALREGARWLRLVDERGAEIDRVPFLFNELNGAGFHFASPAFGAWDGFRSTSMTERRIDGRNLGMFGPPTLFANRADRHLAARGRSILLLPGYTGQVRLTFPAQGSILGPGQAYEVEVIARAARGAETLTIGRWEGEQGGDARPLALDTGLRRFTYPVAYSPAEARRGIYLERSNNGAAIEIESITFQLR